MQTYVLCKLWLFKYICQLICIPINIEYSSNIDNIDGNNFSLLLILLIQLRVCGCVGSLQFCKILTNRIFFIRSWGEIANFVDSLHWHKIFPKCSICNYL